MEETEEVAIFTFFQHVYMIIFMMFRLKAPISNFARVGWLEAFHTQGVYTHTPTCYSTF
jgi:hypothetical protein